MPRPTQPSIPPSEPAPFRHLGNGGAGDRSARLQMLVALVAGLVMVAVPLYLLRRPVGEGPGGDTKASAAAAASAEGYRALSALVATASMSAAGAASASPAGRRGLTLAEPKVLKCVKNGEKVAPEQCDRQTYFEETLAKSVRDNATCAPTVASGGTINFVLDVDFTKKTMHAWAGKSGSFRRRAAKDVVACVNRALTPPDWAQASHQYTRYQIALLATYPSAAAPLPVGPFATSAAAAALGQAAVALSDVRGPGWPCAASRPGAGRAEWTEGRRE